jgi:hypothetical protein
MHAHPLGDLSGAGRARRRLDVRPGTRHRPLLFGWLPG